MEQVFSRSEKVHAQSMAHITRSMSPKKAWQLLEKNNLTTPALIEMTRHLHGKQSNLRRADPKAGYAGVEGARKLLNDMIYESMSKYDTEIAKCTSYYASQCALMEVARGQIFSSSLQYFCYLCLSRGCLATRI